MSERRSSDREVAVVRDLLRPDDRFRVTVIRSVDPAEVGVDMCRSSRPDSSNIPPPLDAGPGLVHEPSTTEAPPAGYVDAHDDVAAPQLPIDPDAGPRT